MKKAILCGKLFRPEHGDVVCGAVVLVENDTVLDVLSDHSAIPAGFEQIDLSDKFVTPGLIDAHVHTSCDGSPDTFATLTTDTAGDIALASLRRAQANLRAGFTTIRDAGSSAFCDVAVRNAINRGEFWGPRMLVSGQSIGSTGGHADSHYSPNVTNSLAFGLVIDGADQARHAARYNIKHGADFLKFMSTGGVLSRGTTVGAQQLTADEIAAIIEIANMYGVHTATHAHGTEGIKAAVRAGVTSVEHGMMLDDEGVALMAEHGTFLVPTIIAAERIIVNGEQNGMADWAVAKAKQVLQNHKNGLAKCRANGINIAFGSDAGTPFNYHGKQGYEFELMVSFGFTALEALTAATLTNARLLRLSDKIGSLEPGKQADLAAFDGDPRTDVKTLAQCRFVMRAGKQISL